MPLGTFGGPLSAHMAACSSADPSATRPTAGCCRLIHAWTNKAAMCTTQWQFTGLRPAVARGLRPRAFHRVAPCSCERLTPRRLAPTGLHNHDPFEFIIIILSPGQGRIGQECCTFFRTMRGAPLLRGSVYRSTTLTR
jgi:hypothetical protein